MSQPGRRPTRVAIKKLRSEKKRQEKVLNAKLSATGSLPNAPIPLPNRCSTFTTVAEEQAAREDAVSKQVRLLRKELPTLLAQLEQIPDPRDPKKRRHKLTVLLLYGMLMFVFQFASRRETNREMTLPQFLATPRVREGGLCGGCSRRSTPCHTPTPCIGCCATSTLTTSNRPTSIWSSG